MIKEFEETACNGNLPGTAFGISIGSTFAAVVKRLVDNPPMPPLGMLTCGGDFMGIKAMTGCGEHGVRPPRGRGAPIGHRQFFLQSMEGSPGIPANPALL
jgi:large-conductance mechanosensitive channel